MSPNYALAQQVEFTDPTIVPEYIHYSSAQGNGEVRAYMVKPAGASGKTPAAVPFYGRQPKAEDVPRMHAPCFYTTRN